MAKIRTNTTEDGQITGQNPDAGGDHYLVGDHNRDIDYLLAKINEWYKFSSTDTTEDFQILYGGVVSDGGSGTINVSAGAALGKDASGNLKLVEIPALTGVALPSGWNNDRQIWVIGQHKYVTTGSTRTHDETGETYNYTIIDSYLGSVTSNNLFVDADPSGNYVIWGSFKMNGTTFTDMNVRSMQYASEQGNFNGRLTGGLSFQTTATPPTVKAGERTVLKNNIKLTADLNLTTSDTLYGISQTWSEKTYTWQRVILDKKGKYKHIPSFDTATTIASGTITSVTIATGTASVLCNSSAGISVNHMVVCKGLSITGTTLYLIGKVTAVPDGTHFELKTPATGTVTVSTGTFEVYGRITTLHGTGAATVINTDADVQKYSPSPLFCAELQGYYLDQYGVPTSTASLAVYRIIGNFYINASSQTDRSIISYKSGFDKNDNFIDGTTAINASVGSTSGYYQYPISNLSFVQGNDYIYTNDTTNGMRITNINLNEISLSVSWGAGSLGGCQINLDGGIQISSSKNSTGDTIPITLPPFKCAAGNIFSVQPTTATNQISNLSFRGKL